MLRRTLRNFGTYRRLRQQTLDVALSPSSLPVYVINLRRSVQRRKYAVQHLVSLGFVPIIFDAVDGRSLRLDELSEKSTYDDSAARGVFHRSLTLAEIGCALSHLGVYREIVIHDLPLALVTEDDVSLPGDSCARIGEIMASAPSDWELIQLRWYARRTERIGEGFVSFPYEDGLPVGATAYVIRQSAARKLLENAFPVRYPADSLLGRAAQWGVVIYGTSTQLADVNNIFPSSIQGGRNWRFRMSNLAKRILLKVFG